MLFTREELVEMGLLQEVASPRLSGCNVVASSKLQVATDLSLYIIYTYFSRLLGCKIIYNLVEINVKGKCETAILPCNPDNLTPSEVLLSIWEKYDLARFCSVATVSATLQPDNVEIAVQATKNSNLYELIRMDWEFYKRFGHTPGDAWDGVLPDDAPPIPQFETTEARIIPTQEVLESAVVERQRVRAGKTMLSLMYESNVHDYTWFEGHDGQWHCFNHRGLV